MKNKSLKDYMDFASKLLTLATGLCVTLTVLGSLFSVATRESIMAFTETLISNGTWGILVLLWVVIAGLDSCGQFNYATYKAKGINRQWVNLIQIKYPYQKWLNPFYTLTGLAIIFNWIF